MAQASENIAELPFKGRYRMASPYRQNVVSCRQNVVKLPGEIISSVGSGKMTVIAGKMTGQNDRTK
jgi:hypothetical protein